MPFDSHFVVPDAAGRGMLLLPDGVGWRLPRWPLAEGPPEREYGFTLALRAWVRERLGIDCAVLHWHNVEADDASRQSVYVLENLSAAHPLPHEARWVGQDELMSVPLAEPHHRSVLEAWFAEAAGGSAPPSRQPWQRAGWLAETSRWIEQQMGAPVGEVTQMTTKGGCCLLRAGGAYLKALPPMYAREPVVTRRLAALRPGCVPEVIAVDADRHWLLTADCAGVWLPKVAELDVWERALRDMAELQIACLGMADELIDLGCPDLRLRRLPALLDELLSDGALLLLGNDAAPAPWMRVALAPEEVDHLRRLAPRLRAACARLAEAGLPETLEHGDFHSGQVLVAQGRPVFVDWADCAVSHPFFSLSRFLSNLFDRFRPHPVAAPPAARDRLRDAYLEPWTAYAPIERLRDAAALALAPLQHALNYYLLDATRRGLPWERSGALATWLRQLSASADSLPVVGCGPPS